MSFRALLNRTVTLKRPNKYVLDSTTVAATLTKSRNPARAALLRVNISGGTDGSGTVTVAGTLSGSSVSEVFTFTANGFQQGAQQFDAITSITTSGLADEATKASINIETLTPDGQETWQYVNVDTSIKTRIEQLSGNSMTKLPGRSAEATHRLFLDYDADINYNPPADCIQDGTIEYEILRADKIYDAENQHHWEILAKLL